MAFDGSVCASRRGSRPGHTTTVLASLLPARIESQRISEADGPGAGGQAGRLAAGGRPSRAHRGPSGQAGSGGRIPTRVRFPPAPRKLPRPRLDNLCMTLPRRIIPGRQYLITRSVRNRRFFISPGDGTNGVNTIFWFCIAAAAEKTGVLVHAATVMGNHIHLVVADPEGELPSFTHWLFRHTALCIKELHGIEENIWSVDKPNVVELVTPEAVLESMAYVMANPTTSGLVRRSKTYPGVCTVPEDLLGRVIEAPPPPQFFRRQSTRYLDLVLPEVLVEEHGREGAIEALRQRVRGMEDEAAEELRSKGRQFLGLKGLAKTLVRGRPKTERKGEKHGYRHPRIKAVVKVARRAALERLRAFWQEYREAWDDFRRGERPCFPAGTWWLVKFAGLQAISL